MKALEQSMHPPKKLQDRPPAMGKEPFNPPTLDVWELVLWGPWKQAKLCSELMKANHHEEYLKLTAPSTGPQQDAAKTFYRLTMHQSAKLCTRRRLKIKNHNAKLSRIWSTHQTKSLYEASGFMARTFFYLFIYLFIYLFETSQMFCDTALLLL